MIKIRGKHPPAKHTEVIGKTAVIRIKTQAINFLGFSIPKLPFRLRAAPGNDLHVSIYTINSGNNITFRKRNIPLTVSVNHKRDIYYLRLRSTVVISHAHQGMSEFCLPVWR